MERANEHLTHTDIAFRKNEKGEIYLHWIQHITDGAFAGSWHIVYPPQGVE